VPIIPTRIDGVIHARVGHVRQWAIGRNRGALPRFRLRQAYGAAGCEAVGAKRCKILAWVEPARRLPIGVNLSEVAAAGARPGPSSEGRCIPRLQLYRMSAQTDLCWYGV
jgi:hypothetical protein